MGCGTLLNLTACVKIVRYKFEQYRKTCYVLTGVYILSLTDRFLEKQVAFESFQMDPFTFINDPNLVVRIGGHYLNWQNAQPAIMALAVFKRPLSMVR